MAANIAAISKVIGHPCRSVDQVLAVDEVLILRVLPLWVAHLVDGDGDDAQKKEEGSEDRHGDDCGAHGVLRVSDVLKLLLVGVLVCTQQRAVVVQGDGKAVNWVKRWEWSWLGMVRGEGLVAADNHVDRRVLGDLISVARVGLHNHVVVRVLSGLSPLITINVDLALLISVQIALVATVGLLIERQVEAKADVVTEAGADKLLNVELFVVAERHRVLVAIRGNLDSSWVKDAELTARVHKWWELHAASDVSEALLVEGQLGIRLGDIQVGSRVVHLDDLISKGLLIDDPDLANFINSI